MDAHSFSRHIRQRVIERLDVHFDSLAKVAEAQILELHMPAHREIRAVDLEDKTCGANRLIFVPHRICERSQIGFMCWVMFVAQEKRNDTRRCGCHKRFSWSSRGHYRLQIVQIK